MKKLFIMTLLLSSIVVETQAMLALAMAANQTKTTTLVPGEEMHLSQSQDNYDVKSSNPRKVGIKKNNDGTYTVVAKSPATKHENVVITAQKRGSENKPKVVMNVIVAHKDFSHVPENVHKGERIAVMNVYKIKAKGAKVENNKDHSLIKFYKKGTARLTAVDHDGNETEKVINVTNGE